MKKLEIRWQEKPLHGKFATRYKNDDVDTEAAHQLWIDSILTTSQRNSH